MPARVPFQNFLELARVDFSPNHRPPSNLRVLAATVLSVVGSLLADALIVLVGTTVFPSTKGYVHFAFGDYARLTIIGVVVAGAAWPVVTRVSSAPRWLYLRLAVLVTLVLLLPDAYLLVKGEPAKAVAVLVTMHVAIALITYHTIVHLAPVRRLRRTERAGAGTGPPG